jgi:hypothetical protein
MLQKKRMKSIERIRWLKRDDRLLVNYTPETLAAMV